MNVLFIAIDSLIRYNPRLTRQPTVAPATRYYARGPGFGLSRAAAGLPAGDVVMLTEDDLATLPLATTRLIDVRAFVPIEQVDPISFNKSYYLEPEPAGIKPYVLLSEALQQSGKAAVVKVARRRYGVACVSTRQRPAPFVPIHTACGSAVSNAQVSKVRSVVRPGGVPHSIPSKRIGPSCVPIQR